MPDTELQDQLELWRAYVPRWAHLPLSGEGAARFGGRWNPIGTPAIYAARELSTAWAEYNQGFVQHPALIVRLNLTGARLADLAEPDGPGRHGTDNSIHQIEWRDEVDRGLVPETYRLREALMRKGFDGVIFPSFMSKGGTCICLWRWNEQDGPQLGVVDPDSRLPHTPASWI